MNLSRATGHCWGCLGVSASRLHPQERGLSWDPQPQERSRLHPQERGLSSDPQPQERSRLAEPCLQIPWGLDATRDSGPSQNIGDSRPLNGEGNGTPLQYSCLENPMDGGAWVTSLSLFTFMHWRRKWQLTPVFLPGESQGRGSLVGCRLWGCTESDTTEVT